MEEKGMAYYLEDLNRVKNLSFEQLELWKSKYPYSQLVHFLMAKKYQLAGLTDNMNIFHRASYFAVDRDHFYERMTNSESESSALATEEIIEAEEILGANYLEAEHLDDFTKTSEIAPEIETSFAENEEIEKEKEEKEKEIPEEIPEETMEETMETPELFLSLEKESKPTPNTNKLSPFAQWLLSLQPETQKFEIEEEILEEEEEEVGDQNLEEKKVKKPKKKKKKKKKEKKKNKLEDQIENSVIMKKEIVSEPLAKILAQQGHNEKAIEMYRKLSLIFPEKSSFFASQIDKINNSN